MMKQSNDEWIIHTGQDQPVSDDMKESYKIVESDARMKCTCSCHRHANVKHVVPCCNNGYIDLL